MSVFESALDAFKEQARNDTQSYLSVEQLKLRVRMYKDFDPSYDDTWPEDVHALFATGALHMVFAPKLACIQRRDFVNHPGHRVGNYAIYLLQSAMNRQGGIRGEGFCIARISATHPLFDPVTIAIIKPFWYNLHVD
jgi:hypothetical protein